MKELPMRGEKSVWIQKERKKTFTPMRGMIPKRARDQGFDRRQRKKGNGRACVTNTEGGILRWMGASKKKGEGSVLWGRHRWQRSKRKSQGQSAREMSPSTLRQTTVILKETGEIDIIWCLLWIKKKQVTYRPESSGVFMLLRGRPVPFVEYSSSENENKGFWREEKGVLQRKS